MTRPYELVKSPKSFKCHCGKKIPAKTYRIEDTTRGSKSKILHCLACGEKLLLSRRAWHRQRMNLINKVLRNLRSKHKDRIVQRLS